jgi:hypothetical protein
LPSLNADQVSTVCEMAQAFGIEQQQLATHLGVTFRSENQP